MPRDAVEHAPNFRLRVGLQICRSGFSIGTAFEIEAQPITLDAAGAAFERLDATPDLKGAVMHVGAIGEIPNLVLRPTRKAMPTQRIITA